MTAPPFLTRTERMVAERVLRAAGYWRVGVDPDEYTNLADQGRGARTINLREVFTTPWPAELACLCSPYANDGIFEECPLHGDPSA